MSRPHLTDFIPIFFAGLMSKLAHRGAEEMPSGAIVESGEFFGPIDGWLPTHTWAERHGMGSAAKE